MREELKQYTEEQKKYSPFEITLIVGLIIFLSISVLCMQGCSTTRIPVSGNREIVHTKWWLESSAKKVDLYYEDPNVTVWMVINDPNSAVNPGSLTVIEPKTGISVGLTAGKGE